MATVPSTTRRAIHLKDMESESQEHPYRDRIVGLTMYVIIAWAVALFIWLSTWSETVQNMRVQFWLLP